MRLRIENELPGIALLTLGLILVIWLVPSTVLRVLLGLPFLLFSPGYTLVSALFPRRGSPEGLERLGLSLGASLILVPLLGMALNYTLGIRLPTVLGAGVLFIAVNSLIAWQRRRNLPPGERWAWEVELPGWGRGWDKALSVVLALSILGAVGTLGYMLLFPKIGEKFTEFYVLGPKGVAADYPRELFLGSEAQVTLGIVNREFTQVSYRMEVRVAGEKVREIGPVTLAHNQRWEEPVGFVPPPLAGENLVEFVLYKVGEASPLHLLQFWVMVSGK